MSNHTASPASSTSEPVAAAAASTTNLRDALTEINAAAHSGFLHIIALATLALRSLETPAGHRDIDDIIYALQIIEARSVEALDSIESCAESVECYYVDPAAHRRMVARIAFQKEAA